MIENDTLKGVIKYILSRKNRSLTASLWGKYVLSSNPVIFLVRNWIVYLHLTYTLTLTCLKLKTNFLRVTFCFIDTFFFLLWIKFIFETQKNINVRKKYNENKNRNKEEWVIRREKMIYWTKIFIDWLPLIYFLLSFLQKQNLSSNISEYFSQNTFYFSRRVYTKHTQNTCELFILFLGLENKSLPGHCTGSNITRLIQSHYLNFVWGKKKWGRNYYHCCWNNVRMSMYYKKIEMKHKARSVHIISSFCIYIMKTI